MFCLCRALGIAANHQFSKLCSKFKAESPPREGKLRVSRSASSGPPPPLLHPLDRNRKNGPSRNWQRIRGLRNLRLFPSGPLFLNIQLFYLNLFRKK